MFLKQKLNRSSVPRSEGGFSLIEVAIALIVISLMMLPIIQTYNIYLITKKDTITKGVTDIVKSAMLKHYQKYGVYPTPANPSIAQGQPGFGAPVPVGAGWPTCTSASTVVCKTASTTFGSYTVLIGDVPFAALGIPYKSSVDGFGRKLKYAVTESLAKTPTDFDDTKGAIEILDKIDRTDPLNPNGKSIYVVGAVTVPRAQFVVLSMGEDGMGAFSLAGVRAVPCTSSTTASQFENCDNDGIFRNNYDSKIGGPDISDGNSADKFDDYVIAVNTTSFGVWSYIPNSALNIEAKNGGNIFVAPRCSECFPSTHVDVVGDVTAKFINTKRLCLSGQADCYDEKSAGVPLIDPPPRVTAGNSGNVGFFSPTMLTVGGAYPVRPSDLTKYPNSTQAQGGVEGAGIRCYNNNSALKGIRYYDEVCATGENTGILSSPSVWGTATVTGSPECGTGTYAYGITINANGTAFSFNCR